jgi:hypothetical protein
MAGRGAPWAGCGSAGRAVDGVEAMEARLLGWTRRQTDRLRRLLP